MNDISSSLPRNKTPYKSQVNKNLECTRTGTSVHACDEASLNEPRMLSPHRTEVITAENKNITETTALVA